LLKTKPVTVLSHFVPLSHRFFRFQFSSITRLAPPAKAGKRERDILANIAAIVNSFIYGTHIKHDKYAAALCER
jgi:hypothetical protein